MACESPRGVLPTSGRNRIERVGAIGATGASPANAPGVPIPVFYHRDNGGAAPMPPSLITSGLNRRARAGVLWSAARRSAATGAGRRADANGAKGSDIPWESGSTRLLLAAVLGGLDPAKGQRRPAGAQAAQALTRAPLHYRADLLILGSDQHRGCLQAALLHVGGRPPPKTGPAALTKPGVIHPMASNPDEKGSQDDGKSPLGICVRNRRIVEGGRKTKNRSPPSARLRLWVVSVVLSANVPAGAGDRQTAGRCEPARCATRPLSAANLARFRPQAAVARRSRSRAELPPARSLDVASHDAELIEEVSADFDATDSSRFLRRRCNNFCVCGSLQLLPSNIAKDPAST